jgi:hypothetical protein
MTKKNNDSNTLPESTDLTQAKPSALSAFRGVSGLGVEVQPLVADEAPSELQSLVQKIIPGQNPFAKFRNSRVAQDTDIAWWAPGTELVELKDVLAIRGIILRSASGLKHYLNGPNPKEDRKLLCQTISMHPSGWSDPVHSNVPFPRPIYGAQEYNKPYVPSREILVYNPSGYRGPCEECVRNGTYVAKHPEAKESSTCGGETTVLFLALEFGIGDIDLSVKRKIVRQWVPFNELKHYDQKTPLYPKPPIINLSLSTSVANKTTAKILTEPNSPVPKEAKVCKAFIDYLYNNGIVQSVKGELYYPAIVEVWAAQAPKEEQVATIKCIPAFNLVEVLDLGDPAYAEMIAYYKSEFVANGGELDEEGRIREPRPYIAEVPNIEGIVYGPEVAAAEKSTVVATPSFNPFTNGAPIPVTATPVPDEMPAVTARTPRANNGSTNGDSVSNEPNLFEE